mmetsp:Transcript_32494/g.49720  ORF Transcript_32494/g.49720 Transcript_32494/m.49720 type:complete len:120 (+) Transcript_32494:16-375(+)
MKPELAFQHPRLVEAEEVERNPLSHLFTEKVFKVDMKFSGIPEKFVSIYGLGQGDIKENEQVTLWDGEAFIIGSLTNRKFTKVKKIIAPNIVTEFTLCNIPDPPPLKEWEAAYAWIMKQ